MEMAKINADEYLLCRVDTFIGSEIGFKCIPRVAVDS